MINCFILITKQPIFVDNVRRYTLINRLGLKRLTRTKTKHRYFGWFFYLGYGVDDVLIVVLDRHKPLAFQHSQVPDHLALDPLQWKPVRTNGQAAISL